MNQEQKQTMAADEVVAMVVNQLCAISVPIGLKEQIADPIAVAVHNLRACLEAWCFYHQSHPQLGIVFALAPSLHSF